LRGDTPVIVNVRDRLTDLRALVEWLERAGYDNLTLLDNASSWPPLLDYLSQSPHKVVKLGRNLGSRALWHAGLVPDAPYVYTDPDVVPTDDCPLDLVEHLHELLDRYPQFSKAGVGLYLDDVGDIPSLAHERELVSEARELEPGVYGSLIDTTFALYRAGTGFGYQAIRTGAPWQARHMGWYKTEPDAETRFYLDRALRGSEGTTSWG
jgi:hypothetical protein